MGSLSNLKDDDFPVHLKQSPNALFLKSYFVERCNHGKQTLIFSQCLIIMRQLDIGLCIS